MSDVQDRRIERIEARMNRTERDVAALSSKLHLIKDDLSRRIDDLNDNLKADAEKIRVDLRERINDLKVDLKDDIGDISNSIDILGVNITALSESLQNLYVSQTGTSVKIKLNEKIIWAVVSIMVSIGIYIAQTMIKGTAQ
jgi:hypothetical protein